MSNYNDLLAAALLDIHKRQGEMVEVIRCENCMWWDQMDEGSRMGYCQAAKHGYYSRHWEISIYRTTERDFFCKDGEPRSEKEEEEEVDGV